MNFKLKQARLSFDPPIQAWRLARRIGLSAQRFSDIEIGKAQPTEILKRKIAKALGKQVVDLFDESK